MAQLDMQFNNELTLKPCAPQSSQLFRSVRELGAKVAFQMAVGNIEGGSALPLEPIGTTGSRLRTFEWERPAILETMRQLDPTVLRHPLAWDPAIVRFSRYHGMGHLRVEDIFNYATAFWADPSILSTEQSAGFFPILTDTVADLRKSGIGLLNATLESIGDVNEFVSWVNATHTVLQWKKTHSTEGRLNPPKPLSTMTEAEATAFSALETTFNMFDRWKNAKTRQFAAFSAAAEKAGGAGVAILRADSSFSLYRTYTQDWLPTQVSGEALEKEKSLLESFLKSVAPLQASYRN